MSVRPTIGDFRTPANNPPRETAPVTEKVESAETLTKQAEALQNSVRDLTPAEQYVARLKEAGIPLKEAQGIFDAVLSKGYYEEYIHIRQQRATFRTRTYEDHLRLQTAIELQQPRLAISQDDLITRYNLAASLFEWQGKAIPHEKESDIDDVMRLIRAWPGPVFSLVCRELAKFDSKIMLVFSEGATESF